MYFLIDYENVRNAGMQGTEYLLPDDHVIVFYSKAAPNMEARHLTDIKKSGCGFSICKLLKVRKNGLDFYIATKVGDTKATLQSSAGMRDSRLCGITGLPGLSQPGGCW